MPEMVTTTTTTRIRINGIEWNPGVMFSDSFHCHNHNCAKHNDWKMHAVANYTNSTTICNEVQFDLTQNFTKFAPNQCRKLKEKNFDYETCRRDYCRMYDVAVQKLWHLGGPGFYGGSGPVGEEECRPFLYFNRTLCETEYRDVEIFCDCFCPTMPLFKPSTDCEEEIMQFLIVARRSPAKLNKFTVSELCAGDLCRWFEQIGNPNPANPPDIAFGIPEVCHTSGLPFRPKQCARMVMTNADHYDPCPWHEAGKKKDTLTCSDGSEHAVNAMEAETWSACASRSFIWKCPANYPIMCEGLDCAGSDDHCCRTSLDRCSTGEERFCSPVLMTNLSEWRGYLTPSAVIRRVTTTTMDPLLRVGLKSRTTTTVRSAAKEVEDQLPLIIVICSGAGAFLLAMIFACLCFGNYKSVMRRVTGAPRLLRSAWADPVHVFRQITVPDGPPLPPMKTAAEVQKELGDERARAALKSAVAAAYRRGCYGFVAFHGCAPPVEEAPLIHAMREAQNWGVHDIGDSVDLMEKGEAWLRTLNAERALVKAASEAAPGLTAMQNKINVKNHPVPWLSTQWGQRVEGDIKDEGWSAIEDLGEALRYAAEAGADVHLIKKKSNLLAELVARTRELPQDRCVLDPDGVGLKLLPKGHMRALKGETGDPYIYNKDTRISSDVEEPPPRDVLFDVDPDPARPVCADFASGKPCRGGRRCPWRHQKPQAGDAVRECILRQEKDR